MTAINDDPATTSFYSIEGKQKRRFSAPFVISVFFPDVPEIFSFVPEGRHADAPDATSFLSQRPSSLYVSSDEKSPYTMMFPMRSRRSATMTGSGVLQFVSWLTF
jgi:hypothetical protein